MSLFIETVLVKNKRAPFLPLHEKRMNLTRRKFSLGLNPLKIRLPYIPDSNSYRLRIIYGKKIEKVALLPYSLKKKKKIQTVDLDIYYPYKFLNRSIFDGLLAKFDFFDDVLIINKGLVTDTTIANVAFSDGKKWFTPSTPLLKGTTRERLISSGFLTPKKIYKSEIYNYSRVGFMNALSGFYIAGETKKVIKI